MIPTVLLVLSPPSSFVVEREYDYYNNGFFSHVFLLTCAMRSLLVHNIAPLGDVGEHVRCSVFPHTCQS